MPIHLEFDEMQLKLEQAKGEIAAIASQHIQLTKDIASFKDEIPILQEIRNGLLKDIDTLNDNIEKRRNERSEELNQLQDSIEAKAKALDERVQKHDEIEKRIFEEYRAFVIREEKFRQDEENVRAQGEQLNSIIAQNKEKSETLDNLIIGQEEKLQALKESTAVMKQFSQSYEEKKEEASTLIVKYQAQLDGIEVIQKEAEKRLAEANERFATLNNKQVALDQQQAEVDDKLAKVADADKQYLNQMATLDEKEKRIKLVELKVRALIEKNKIDMEIKELGG